MKRVLIFLLLAALCPPALAAAADRPNILLIVADDQSPFDFRIYNETSELSTPTLDSLAARGVVLDAAYHMGAWAGDVCTPSRHMIMTGRSVWHVPDKTRPGRSPHAGDEALVPSDLAENSMAAVFNRAGYQTMRTCKQGNSYEGANAKFTVRHEAMKRGATDQTGSAWHADRVIDFLNDRDSNGADAPFLVYLGFSHPHDVRDGKPKLLAKYGATNDIARAQAAHQKVNPASPQLPINYLPRHPFPLGHPNLRDEEQVQGVWDYRTEAVIRNELGREYACAENIDTQVGRVLRRLEELGELDNTYVIYTSDHGIAIGRHGLTGKQNLYEHTWRVPLVVMGPGLPAGARAGGNTYLSDMLATICDLAGIEAPATCEGTSCRPVLEGDQSQVRDVMYGVYSGGTKPGIRAVRKGDWKLIKYDVLDGTVHQTQLFNLADNPWELLEEHHDAKVVRLTHNEPITEKTNLADSPEHREKLDEMQALLMEQQQHFDDPYRLWDQPVASSP